MAAAVAVPPVEVAGSYLRLGDGFVATLIVTGYPVEVGPAWLEPLLGVAARVDVAVYVEPLPGQVAAGRLRRQRARLESVRWSDADHARIPDPARDAAAADAADLADRLARGAARLFRVGVYLTVHAPTRDDLMEAVGQVKAAAASVLLDLQPATWRQLQGWTTTLPLGTDTLHGARIMDTDGLAAAFPLASPDLPAPLPGDPPQAGGILYGANTASGGIVWWDRWACDNYNSVVLARSGAGKSYLVKLEILRNLYSGVQVAVIDPEAEYLRLAEAVAGTVINLGAPGIHLNPLDIPPGDHRPDALTRRALFLHTLVTVLLGEQPPPAERAALDTAVIAAYNRAGISNDPATWTLPAPLLRDVTAELAPPAGTSGAPDEGPGRGAGGSGPGATLAARLAPWTEGSFSGLFEGPTTFRPRGHLIVWCTRQLPDELRATGMLLALDAIWRDIDTTTQTSPRRRTPAAPTTTGTGSATGTGSGTGDDSTGIRVGPRRLVVIDEAWSLLREGEGARFCARLAKAARKRRAGLTVVTQDAADLLSSDPGRAVVSNAATQILLRQAPQAIDLVADQFGLTDGEARLLLCAPQGEALLLSGQHRVGFHALASPYEHHLAAGLSDLPDHDTYADHDGYSDAVNYDDTDSHADRHDHEEDRRHTHQDTDQDTDYVGTSYGAGWSPATGSADRHGFVDRYRYAAPTATPDQDIEQDSTSGAHRMEQDEFADRDSPPGAHDGFGSLEEDLDGDLEDEGLAHEDVGRGWQPRPGRRRTGGWR